MKKHDDNDDPLVAILFMWGSTFIISAIYLLIKIYVLPWLFR